MKSFSSIAIGGAMALAFFGCNGQVLGKDAGGKPGGGSVFLEQDFQNVAHIDCQGKVTSQGIEPVLAPTQLVTIRPINYQNLAGSKFYNTTTGSAAPAISGYTTFIIDHGDGALDMHVISGTNTIVYTFYSCDSGFTAEGICNSALTVSEQGTSTINVNYTERTVPGTLTYDDCAPAPTPSPTPVNITIH